MNTEQKVKLQKLVQIAVGRERDNLRKKKNYFASDIYLIPPNKFLKGLLPTPLIVYAMLKAEIKRQEKIADRRFKLKVDSNFSLYNFQRELLLSDYKAHKKHVAYGEAGARAALRNKLESIYHFHKPFDPDSIRVNKKKRRRKKKGKLVKEYQPNLFYSK